MEHVRLWNETPHSQGAMNCALVDCFANRADNHIPKPLCFDVATKQDRDITSYTIAIIRK